MFKKLKILHNKSLVRAKVNNSISEDIKDVNKTFWLKEEFIDDVLIKENLEVIKLYYDKYSKWITLHNASVLWFLAMLLWYWWEGLILNTMLLFFFITSLISATFVNIRLNKTFNTLLRKTKEISNKK